MLDSIKAFFREVKEDKKEIEKEVVDKTTSNERSVYRVWWFCLMLVLMGTFSVVFILGAPCFIYCAYRTYVWMRDGNKKDTQ